MNNNNKSDTFSESDLLSLMNSVQNGDRAAEGKLLSAAESSVLIMVRNWYKADENDPNVQDAGQGIKLRLIEQLRKRPREIKDPKGYIETVARNYLRGVYGKKKAEKRTPPKINEEGLSPEQIFIDRGGYEVSLEAQAERAHEDLESSDYEPKADPALGELSEDLKEPDEVYERRENNEIDKIIRQFMDQLPKDLREGIEKSLDLIVDLFRTRSNLRDKLKRDFQHSWRILKVIGSIAEARKLLGKFRYPDPKDRGLLGLRKLREMSAPALSGRPEEDNKYDEWLEEVKDLEKKFGVDLNLYEAQLELSAEILNPEVELRLAPGYLLDPGFLVDYQSPWIDHLSEIAGMKVSPLNLIYKVWSRAPGFRKAGSGKYRNRKGIEFALYSYKKTSKGTDREFLFSSIKNDAISSLEELENKFERFRKAGYGQALKKKYRPIVEIIYKKAFRNAGRKFL